MSPTLNGSSAIWRFELSEAIEIHDGIIFEFYVGQPHMVTCSLVSHTLRRKRKGLVTLVSR